MWTHSAPALFRSPWNGGLHTAIPGRLLLFPAPDAALSESGADWADTPDGRRRFGAGFYGALLRDLGAVVVVALDPVDYDPAPLQAAGLAVYTLHDLGGGRPDEQVGSAGNTSRPTLQMLDRFIAIADAAAAVGGLVAVHCGGARGGLEQTLIAAYAVRQGLFGRPAEALAWLQLVRPAGGGGAAAGGATADLRFLELVRRQCFVRSSFKFASIQAAIDGIQPTEPVQLMPTRPHGPADDSDAPLPALAGRCRAVGRGPHMGGWPARAGGSFSRSSPMLLTVTD
jgi:hypothetical protein